MLILKKEKVVLKHTYCPVFSLLLFVDLFCSSSFSARVTSRIVISILNFNIKLTLDDNTTHSLDLNLSLAGMCQVLTFMYYDTQDKESPLLSSFHDSLSVSVFSLCLEMRSFFVLSCLLAIACAAQVDYSGHKVIRANVVTSKQADFLVEMRENLDFWTEVGMGR